MPLKNSYVFTETNFNSEKFLANTKNAFKFVSQRPYKSKKDPDDTGMVLTLAVYRDSTDYGIDKETGFKRENNEMNTFDVTVLNGKNHLDVKKGEFVRLIDYIPEKSFVIGFDLLLRYKNVEKINVKTQ